MEMGGLGILHSFLEKTSRDGRIGPAHISLFTAILKCWSDQGYVEPITIVSKELMLIAKIFSPTTYHRTIRQLDEFGYIIYKCTSSKWESNKISIRD